MWREKSKSQPDQAWEMYQAMCFSEGIICKLQLVFFPEKRKPVDYHIIDKFSCSIYIQQEKQCARHFHILFFFNFKSDHIILWSNAIGNKIRLHATTPVVVCFNVFLILGPARSLSCTGLYSRQGDRLWICTTSL